MDCKTNLNELKKLVKEFCDERDWDQYHNAKELAIGIVTEAAELLDIFRFKSEEEIDKMFEKDNKRKEITEEMSDVLYFVLRMAQRYDIDITSEFRKKLDKNREKYPTEKARGCNKKYTEF